MCFQQNNLSSCPSGHSFKLFFTENTRPRSLTITNSTRCMKRQFGKQCKFNEWVKA